ncbi:MAG: hypothetical protein KY468_16025 [Armatimonadetes bacterium]|nr:hypothetical protein [Armatimonadota bacterium]
MKEIRYSLITDGPSDQALIPLLTWTLRNFLTDYAIQPQWADLRRLPRPPKLLSDRIEISLELFPCDLLFIHRDAERDTYASRKREIQSALQSVNETVEFLSVCVVPVRMQEAWLLFDESAIRQASGNPNGTDRLQLPRLAEIESEPDPKQILHSLLKEASGLHGRRLRDYPVSTSARRVAEFIEDYSPLRVLPAFNALEKDVTNTLSIGGWL